MRLDLPCKDWGFSRYHTNTCLGYFNFFISEYGLEKTKAKKDSKLRMFIAEFFELPLEEKNRISMLYDDVQAYKAMAMLTLCPKSRHWIGLIL